MYVHIGVRTSVIVLLGRASIAVLKHHRQVKLGQEFKWDRDQEPGADADTMEGCCLMACSA